MTSYNAGKECRKCYWYDVCDHPAICGYYYNVVDNDYTDAEIADMVERGRRDYERSYREYVAEFE